MDRCGLSNDSINGMIVPLAQAQRLEELCLRIDIITPSSFCRATRSSGPRPVSLRPSQSPKDTRRSILISLKVEINLQMVTY